MRRPKRTFAIGDKFRVIKVRPSHGGPWCVCDDWSGVGQMIEDDGVYEFEFELLTREQYDAIPDDFPGW